MIKAEPLMAVLVLSLFAALFLSGRPFPPENTPRVDEIETLPSGPEMAAVRRFTQIGSATLPYNRFEHDARAETDWSQQPLKLGWSYREVTFASLPMFAYREFGLVTFIEQPSGFNIAILQPKQVELLQELTGRDYSGYSFPYWRHMWGWLFVIGFVAAGLLFYREAEQKREAAGII